MADENFDRAVIFVLSHGEEGAVGLVLNKPSEQNLGSLLSEWQMGDFHQLTVFRGGPVDAHSAMALGRFVGEIPDSMEFIFANIGVVDLSKDPESLPPSLIELRPYLGYSGWGPMQLEAELAANAWFVVEADPLDMFIDENQDLWSMVLRRQQGPMSWMSNYPPDPRMN